MFSNATSEMSSSSDVAREVASILQGSKQDAHCKERRGLSARRATTDYHDFFFIKISSCWRVGTMWLPKRLNSNHVPAWRSVDGPPSLVSCIRLNRGRACRPAQARRSSATQDLPVALGHWTEKEGP